MLIVGVGMVIQEYPGARLDESAPLSARAKDAYARGINYFQALQQQDGHWAGDYGGNNKIHHWLHLTLVQRVADGHIYGH